MNCYFRWQELDEQIPTYPEFQRQDFSVVSQSFSRGPVPVTSNGHFDLRYTSADCFHFSQLMHARGEYNNLQLCLTRQTFNYIINNVNINSGPQLQ